LQPSKKLRRQVSRYMVCAVVGILGLLLDPSMHAADGAELRIRKELLIRQSDRALINVIGRVEFVETIPDKGDCQLQASIRVEDIRVAVVGEWINACSTKLEPNEIAALAERLRREPAAAVSVSAPTESPSVSPAPSPESVPVSPTPESPAATAERRAVGEPRRLVRRAGLPAARERQCFTSRRPGCALLGWRGCSDLDGIGLDAGFTHQTCVSLKQARSLH